MNILITGCAGFIGYHLCYKLISKKHKIIGIDSLNKYYDLNLKKNLISGVALDVVKNEPLKKNFNLLKYNNVIVTPHIAAINTSYKVDQVDLFSYNLRNFLNKKKLKYKL